jgi:hypothetical protein
LVGLKFNPHTHERHKNGTNGIGRMVGYGTMRKYALKWSNLGKVKDIYPIIKERPVSVSDELFPQLKARGVYLFIDDQKGIIDVGEANPAGRGLRNRIRNEIYANSAFSKKLIDLGMERPAQLDLTVKVATVEQGIDFSESPEEIDKHLHLIEKALICETDPWSNSHGGVDNWGNREEVEIANQGECKPLNPTIKRFKKEQCPKRKREK